MTGVQRGRNGMAPLPSWADLEPVVPQMVDTMRRYLAQVGCVLRPGSVKGADLALRCFAGFLTEADPAVVTPYLGRWVNPDLGDAALSLREGKLDFAASGIRSELRPLVGADGGVAGYLFTDAPLGGFTQELLLTLEQDASGGPRLVLTAKDDDGQDLVYRYEPVRAATTLAP